MKPTKATLTLREIARLEAGSNLKLQPVIEKELIHYEIIRAMSENGFLERLCFQGGTALRLCYGSDRFSEDLDFTGGEVPPVFRLPRGGVHATSFSFC